MTNNLLYMVGYISLGVILIGSLMYILSGTHENLKNKGKDALKAALVGAVVSWTGWILVNFFIDNL